MFENRTLLRLAVAVHEQFADVEHSPTLRELPHSSWLRCETLERRMHRAQQLGWNLAANRYRRDLRQAIEGFNGELLGIGQSLADNGDPKP